MGTNGETSVVGVNSSKKKKTGGRAKGTPNKTTKALKEMILSALDEQEGGGIEYLKRQAEANPSAFMTLLGKVLPTTLAGDPNNPVGVVAKIERVLIG